MTFHFTPYLDDIKNQIKRPDVAKIPASGPYRRVFKRVIDVSLILLSLPFVLPLIVLMALLIGLDGHNPFYKQRRIGKNGQVFTMWKLRTMVHDADSLLEDYLAEDPAARHEWNTTQKLKKDPRITFAGRLLRKTSMDELPQLFNVFNGTMSLVGPRPMMVSQKDSYPGLAYYNLRPGITGLWQVSDRNHCEFRDRAAFDDQYERQVSLVTDMRILLRTIQVVLRGTGY